MTEWWMPEFRTENRKWIYWLARQFGSPVMHEGKVCAYIWRYKWYVMPDDYKPGKFFR